MPVPLQIPAHPGENLRPSTLVAEDLLNLAASACKPMAACC